MTLDMSTACQERTGDWLVRGIGSDQGGGAEDPAAEVRRRASSGALGARDMGPSSTFLRKSHGLQEFSHLHLGNKSFDRAVDPLQRDQGSRSPLF